jgi:hypothetical protein
MTHTSLSSRGNDPYIALIGSLPALPTAQQVLEWIHRQRGRLAEGNRTVLRTDTRPTIRT